MRIDAHQHFWSYSAEHYGWIVDNGLTALERDFLPADLRPLLDAHGIDGTVAVQAQQSEEETRWLLGLADDHDWIRGVVGWTDLRAPDRAERIAALAHPRLVGIRHVVQDEADGFMEGEEFREGVRAVGAAGLVYDVLILGRQMDEAAELCGALDGQRLVLDHVGKPDIAGGAGMEAWGAALAALGAMDHVTVKLSGLVTEADWKRWTEADLVPVLDAALEAFGPGRVMFGSDWPVCTLAASYDRVHGVVERWASGLSEDERAALFGGTARKVYLGA